MECSARYFVARKLNQGSNLWRTPKWDVERRDDSRHQRDSRESARLESESARVTLEEHAGLALVDDVAVRLDRQNADLVRIPDREHVGREPATHHGRPESSSRPTRRYSVGDLERARVGETMISAWEEIDLGDFLSVNFSTTRIDRGQIRGDWKREGLRRESKTKHANNVVRGRTLQGTAHILAMSRKSRVFLLLLFTDSDAARKRVQKATFLPREGCEPRTGATQENDPQPFRNQHWPETLTDNRCAGLLQNTPNSPCELVCEFLNFIRYVTAPLRSHRRGTPHQPTARATPHRPIAKHAGPDGNAPRN